MKRMLALLGITALVGTAAAIPIGSAGAGLEAGQATVYVVHGIPGVPVDICIDDSLVAEDVQPGATLGPLSIAPGTYDVELNAVGEGCNDTIYEEDVVVPDGSSTIVAWNTVGEGTEPDLALFANDVSCTEPGTGRITARHAAGAAGDVDVFAGTTEVISDLAQGTQKVLDVPVGTYPLTVKLAGTETVVLGPADVPAVEGKNVIVHVVNQLEDGEGLQPASAIPLILDVGVCTAPVEVQPTFTG